MYVCVILPTYLPTYQQLDQGHIHLIAQQRGLRLDDCLAIYSGDEGCRATVYIIQRERQYESSSSWTSAASSSCYALTYRTINDHLCIQLRLTCDEPHHVAIMPICPLHLMYVYTYTNKHTVNHNRCDDSLELAAPQTNTTSMSACTYTLFIVIMTLLTIGAIDKGIMDGGGWFIVSSSSGAIMPSTIFTPSIFDSSQSPCLNHEWPYFHTTHINISLLLPFPAL